MEHNGFESMWNIFDNFKIDEGGEDIDNGIGNAGTNDKNDTNDTNNKTDNVDDLHCKDCNTSNSVILEDGNYVCNKCGTMISRFIDTTAEWRFYGFEDSRVNDPTRCGLTNELLPNIGSTMGWAKYETKDIHMMRKYHMWNSMTYKERSLYNIFDTLTTNALINGIPKNIIEEAKVLYKSVSEKKISRGDNRNGLIASSIYISCKKNNVPRSAKEIAKIFNIKVPTMTKGCKQFQEIMNISINSTTADDFVNRFCSKLNIDKNNIHICKSTLQKIEEHEILLDNIPPSLAASSIFICNTHYCWGISKKELSLACDISQVTISKCFKKLLCYTDLLFSNICE